MVPRSCLQRLRAAAPQHAQQDPAGTESEAEGAAGGHQLGRHTNGKRCGHVVSQHVPGMSWHAQRAQDAQQPAVPWLQGR